MAEKGVKIAPAEGKLGVLLVGLGAVSTTFVAGVEAIKRGLAHPIGSLTQMGTIRLGKRTDNRVPRIKDFLPLAGLDQLEFASWDLFPDNAYDAAKHAAVLEAPHVDAVKEELQAITPMPAVFYPEYVKRLRGSHVKRGASKAEMVEQVRSDIVEFTKTRECSRAVAVWCGSTEVFIPPGEVHQSI